MSSDDVRIGRCTVDDIDDLIAFIDTYWKRGHVLARCRALLDWQHRDSDGAGYSFVLARRDGELIGVLGYIATRRFDPALARDSVVWLTMWRVREQAGTGGVGLALLQHLTRIEPHRAIGAVGLNPETCPMYRALGYRVGELTHFARPNAACTRFELATLTDVPMRAADGPPLARSDMTAEEQFAGLARADAIAGLGRVPKKTPRYFCARYLRHPVYDYRVLALHDGTDVVGLMAARVAEHAGRRALRIVDVLAEPDVIARTGPIVDSLLAETGAEYADVYNEGIERRAFERAGFTAIEPDGPQVVPDHFEPFERRNVRLWYAFSGAGVLFKGDADQDRPNAVGSDRT